MFHVNVLVGANQFYRTLKHCSNHQIELWCPNLISRNWSCPNISLANMLIDITLWLNTKQNIPLTYKMQKKRHISYHQLHIYRAPKKNMPTLSTLLIILRQSKQQTTLLLTKQKEHLNANLMNSLLFFSTKNPCYPVADDDDQRGQSHCDHLQDEPSDNERPWLHHPLISKNIAHCCSQPCNDNSETAYYTVTVERSWTSAAWTTCAQAALGERFGKRGTCCAAAAICRYKLCERNVDTLEVCTLSPPHGSRLGIWRTCDWNIFSIRKWWAR